jgi:hypothetical protein
MSAPSESFSRATPHHAEGAPWNFQDAARYLGISERHLANLADRKEVATFRLGRRRFVADAELRRLAEGR